MNENPNENAQIVRTPPPGGYRPKLSLYHASAKGNGSALKAELHPAHDDVDGSIMLTVAPQKSVGGRGGFGAGYSTFAWEGAITVKLDFNDLTKMLQVFRGESESIADDKGLYHQSLSGNTTIKLKHVVDASAGYMLELYRSVPGRPECDRSTYFFFRTSEALGLATAIEGSLCVIAFGIPRVIPHDTSAYRRETKEMRNATAA